MNPTTWLRGTVVVAALALLFSQAAGAAEAVTSGRPEARPLAIGGVTASLQEVPLYGLVEFTVDLSATYDNPFDPDHVALDAVFHTPSGTTERLPGFYDQDFGRSMDGNREVLTPRGEPSWRVRYAPREVGDYSVSFTARDRSGTVHFGSVEFRCVKSDDAGFARISSQASGPRYFRLDSGRTLFLIGHNVTGYFPQEDAAFDKMVAGGENYTRFWMYRWSLPLDWGPAAGRYSLQAAWQLDRTLALARERGIYIMLCFDTHQDFLPNAWPRNPYSTARGGPCEGPLDFFTNAQARDLYKKRLRYIVARWGWQTSLLAWEFANEMEGWPGAQEHRDTVAAWCAEMGGYLAGTDPYGHPVTTSLWTTEGWPEIWKLPQMQFVQSHFYANNRFADMAADIAAICRQKLRDYPGKLHLFAEYGTDSRGPDGKVDPTGVHLHNGNWAALMSGSASNPVSWWHREYIDAFDLYHVYRGLANYVRGEDLAGRTWRLIDDASVRYTEPPAKVSYREVEFSGTANGWGKPLPEGTSFTVRRDGTVEDIDKLPTLLQGRGHADLRSALVFNLDCARPIEFKVRVGTVSAGATLQFDLDGKTLQTYDLPAGKGLERESRFQPEWNIYQTDYDRYFGIDVPAGRHTVRLFNDGKDWLQAASILLTGYQTDESPDLRVLGMESGDRALFWVQNKAHTWFDVRDAKPIGTVSASVLSVGGLSDGAWRAEIWDTGKGAVISSSEVQAEGGRVEVPLPEIATDVAVKLIRG
jgi:hypothetical protein